MDTHIDLTPYREQYSYFAKRLLQDLGLADLPQEDRNQLLAAIETYTQQVLTNTLLENIEDAHIEQIEMMSARDADQDEILTYLVMNIPGLEGKIADAMAKTYAQLLKDCAALTSAIAERHQDSNVPVEPATSAAE